MRPTNVQPQASWYGHFTPNKSACGPDGTHARTARTGVGGGKCPYIGDAACASAPCLFDMSMDKTEHVDVAQ